MAQAIDRLSDQPNIGASVPGARLDGVRRIYLRRVHYHLYYRIVGVEVELLTLWHASRESGPDLCR